jgi:hypothetical protein
MKLGYFLCAEYIVLDSRTNNYSAFNILDRINSKTFPLLIPRLEILALFDKENHDPEHLKVDFMLNDNEEEISKDSINISFLGKDRSRTLFSIDSLAIKSPGFLKILIVCQNHELGAYKIAINQIGKPQIHLSQQA